MEKQLAELGGVDKGGGAWQRQRSLSNFHSAGRGSRGAEKQRSRPEGEGGGCVMGSKRACM